MTRHVIDPGQANPDEIKRKLIKTLTYADLTDADTSQTFTDAAALPDKAVPVAWIVKVPVGFVIPSDELFLDAYASNEEQQIDGCPLIGEETELRYPVSAIATAGWLSSGVTLSSISIRSATEDVTTATEGCLEIWAEYYDGSLPDQPKIVAAETGQIDTQGVTITFSEGDLAGVSSYGATFSLSDSSATADGLGAFDGRTVVLAITGGFEVGELPLLTHAPTGAAFITAGGRFVAAVTDFPVTNNVMINGALYDGSDAWIEFAQAMDPLSNPDLAAFDLSGSANITAYAATKWTHGNTRLHFVITGTPTGGTDYITYDPTGDPLVDLTGREIDAIAADMLIIEAD